MRPARGCEACRERHVKCVSRAGNETCVRCADTGRHCLFTPRFRFRIVDHVDSHSQGTRTRYELRYGADQKWLTPRRNINFILEDGSGLEYGIPDTDETVSEKSNNRSIQATPSGLQCAVVNEPLALPLAVPAGEVYASPVPPGSHPCRNEPVWQAPDTPRPCTAGVNGEDFASPASISELSRRHEDATSALSPAFPPPFSAGSTAAADAANKLFPPGAPPRAELSRREASLLQHFIRKIAPWMDVCDLTCQFTHEVPRRAMQTRMVLFAVLAVASRHLAIMARGGASSINSNGNSNGNSNSNSNSNGNINSVSISNSNNNSTSEPAEAAFYHGQAVRLVIDALAAPLHRDDRSGDDANLLATVVCLRLYEELEHSTDEHLHLRGMSRLLRAIPDFASTAGLAAAACWQALRQDIYIALVLAQPPTFRLESFERSSVFAAFFRDNNDDDGACANVVVLLFAKILRQAYSSCGSGGNGGDNDENNDEDDDNENDTDNDNDVTAWNRLEMDVDAWNTRRLHRFQPIYYESADVAAGRPFPIIQMISPPQVAALQYYHACRTFLALHKPADRTLSGFAAAKRRRAVERDVAHELAAIVGLAQSNPFVENANFTALHLLRTAGYCITNVYQRQRVLEFLRHMENIMGWGTSMVVTLLQQQWNDLDHPGD